MSAEQSIQEVSISAFIQIDCSASLLQQIQLLSASATNYNPTATQKTQSALGFLEQRLEIAGVISQPIQALSTSAFYYDIAINGSMSQSIQEVAVTASYSYLGAGIVQQTKQTLSAYCDAMVITARIPRNLINDYRILRAIRNKGAR